MPPGTSIVFEKLLHLGRSRGFRRTVAAVVLPFVGVVAAFGIAPNTVTDPIALTNVVENIELTPTATAKTEEETYWREERIQRGDTIANLLTRLRVDDAKASNFLRSSVEARGLRQLSPGRMLRAQTGEDGRLLELRYSTGVMMLVVKPHGESFRVTEQAAPVERRVVMRSGIIRSSLYAATDAAQLTDAIADQLAQIFSTDIDFHKDLRRGDRFTVLFEMYYEAGEPVRSGRLLGAEFVNQGKAYQAVWFQHGINNQGGDYYSLEGKPIRKTFLRSPLEFSRITSGFTTARFHPILQRWRAHNGVDYAAATGTRVKATADGTVEFAGRSGGYGNVVVLRHHSRYTTLYGHLSGFARGIRTGAPVSQGTVIGYVGSTGLATGPHLHYELRINDVYQDPLRVAVIPEAPTITAGYRAAFDAVARPMAEQLGLLRTTNLARLD